MLQSTIASIEDDQLLSLNFPQEDVIDSRKGRLNRMITLKRIQHLASLGMEKVTILFVDDKGIKKIESSIFKFTDHFIFLNECYTIPLNRILHMS